MSDTNFLNQNTDSQPVIPAEQIAENLAEPEVPNTMEVTTETENTLPPVVFRQGRNLSNAINFIPGAFYIDKATKEIYYDDAEKGGPATHQKLGIGKLSANETSAFFNDYENNTAEGSYSATFGCNNKNDGNFSFITGFGNVNSGVSSFMTGNTNSLSGSNSLMAGTNNTSDYSTTYVFGQHLTSASNDQMIIGQYNVNDPAMAFMIGNGTSAQNKNIFSVSKTGVATVANSVICPKANVSSEITINRSQIKPYGSDRMGLFYN